MSDEKLEPYDMTGANVYRKTTLGALVQMADDFSVIIRGFPVPGKAGDYYTYSYREDGTKDEGVLDKKIRDETYETTSSSNDDGTPLFRKITPTLAKRHPLDAAPVTIPTLEGPMVVRPGDWVLQNPTNPTNPKDLLPPGLKCDQWPRDDSFFTRHYEVDPRISVRDFENLQSGRVQLGDLLNPDSGTQSKNLGLTM